MAHRSLISRSRYLLAIPVTTSRPCPVQPPRKSNATTEGDVPSVMLTLGSRFNKLCFISHPGVMAVSKLLEMSQMVRHQAEFTQENVNAIREFDSQLADKCQIAFDNGLQINMMDLEYIDDPVFLSKLIEEKNILSKIRSEVLSLPANGPYKLSSEHKDYKYVTVDTSNKPQYEIGPEVFEAQPGLRQQIELQGIVKSYINATKEWMPSQAEGKAGASVKKIDAGSAH